MNIRKIQAILLSFLLILLATSADLLAQTDEGVQVQFDRANEALEQGDLQQALTIYHFLEQESRISGALFLNMGITYARFDSLGKAKYYLLKASRFDEIEQQAVRNLDFIEDQFSRTPATLPQLPWEKAVDWLRLNIGALNLLLWGILFLNAGAFLFVSSWFILTRFNRWINISGRSLATAGVLVILLSFYVDYVDNRYSEAVMVNSQTSVMEQASADAPVVSQAYEGYSFVIDHYKSNGRLGWSYVRMGNGQYGWIPNEDILIL